MGQQTSHVIGQSDKSKEVSRRPFASTQHNIGWVGRYHSESGRKLEQDYEIRSTVLGTGVNGSVYLAAPKHGNVSQSVAVKKLKLRGIRQADKTRLKREVEIFLRLDHPHVIRLLDVYEDEDYLSLVMECATGGELFNRVSKVKRFSEPEAADAMAQIMLALHYLHTNEIVHRDLKLENFVYDVEDGNQLKMLDFGFSRYTGRFSRLKTKCGTLTYVAPEVLRHRGSGYTSQCDLWSAGVMAYILLFGRMPFSGSESSDQQIDKLDKGTLFTPQRCAGISETAKEFVCSLLEWDPTQRLNSKQALEHRWIAARFEQQKVSTLALNGILSWASAPKLHRAYMIMSAWNLTNEHQASVRDCFVALDADHDGMISDRDLQEVMTSKLRVTKEDAREKTQSFRGAKISYTDFLAAMACSNQIGLNDALLQATFTKFDSSDSGYISAHEVNGMLGSTFAGDAAGELLQATEQKDGQVYYPEFVNCIRKYNSGGIMTTGPAQLVEQPLPNLLSGQAASRDRAAEHVEQPLDKAKMAAHMVSIATACMLGKFRFDPFPALGRGNAHD